MWALFRITTERLEQLPVLKIPPSCGAVVSFWGLVRNRNEDREVTGLEYTCYEALALKEGERIMVEAMSSFELGAARAVHRVGSLGIGEAAVVVEVATGHRPAGFEACRWIIDQIKDRVPIWKRELYVEGDREWVMCPHPHTTTAS